MRIIISAILLIVCFSTKTEAQNLIKAQNKMIGETIEKIEFTDYIENLPTDIEFDTKFKVLEFWATWCKPCLKAVPHLNELNSKFKDENNLVFLSITYETPEKTQATLEKIKFETIVVSDQNKEIHKALRIEHEGTMVLPRTVLIDDTNKIVWYGTPNELNQRMLKRFINREKL